jgi:hypothetical protein
VRRSTITQMESQPLDVLGSPTIKSILISSHYQDGTGEGCNSLADFRWTALTRWHVTHLATYYAISIFIFVHQNICFRSWYILLLPGWIENLDKCASSRICCHNSGTFGTTRWFLNQRTPLSSIWKHGAFPVITFSLIWAIPLFSFWATTIWLYIVDSTMILAKVPYETISIFNFSIS